MNLYALRNLTSRSLQRHLRCRTRSLLYSNPRRGFAESHDEYIARTDLDRLRKGPVNEIIVNGVGKGYYGDHPDELSPIAKRQVDEATGLFARDSPGLFKEAHHFTQEIPPTIFTYKQGDVDVYVYSPEEAPHMNAMTIEYMYRYINTPNALVLERVNPKAKLPPPIYVGCLKATPDHLVQLKLTTKMNSYADGHISVIDSLQYPLDRMEPGTTVYWGGRYDIVSSSNAFFKKLYNQQHITLKEANIDHLVLDELNTIDPTVPHRTVNDEITYVFEPAILFTAALRKAVDDEQAKFDELEVAYKNSLAQAQVNTANTTESESESSPTTTTTPDAQEHKETQDTVEDTRTSTSSSSSSTSSSLPSPPKRRVVFAFCSRGYMKHIDNLYDIIPVFTQNDFTYIRNGYGEAYEAHFNEDFGALVEEHMNLSNEKDMQTLIEARKRAPDVLNRQSIMFNDFLSRFSKKTRNAAPWRNVHKIFTELYGPLASQEPTCGKCAYVHDSNGNYSAICQHPGFKWPWQSKATCSRKQAVFSMQEQLDATRFPPTPREAVDKFALHVRELAIKHRQKMAAKKKNTLGVARTSSSSTTTAATSNTGGKGADGIHVELENEQDSNSTSSITQTNNTDTVTSTPEHVEEKTSSSSTEQQQSTPSTTSTTASTVEDSDAVAKEQTSTATSQDSKNMSRATTSSSVDDTVEKDEYEFDQLAGFYHRDYHPDSVQAKGLTPELFKNIPEETLSAEYSELLSALRTRDVFPPEVCKLLNIDEGMYKHLEEFFMYAHKNNGNVGFLKFIKFAWKIITYRPDPSTTPTSKTTTTTTTPTFTTTTTTTPTTSKFGIVQRDYNPTVNRIRQIIPQKELEEMVSGIEVSKYMFPPNGKSKFQLDKDTRDNTHNTSTNTNTNTNTQTSSTDTTNTTDATTTTTTNTTDTTTNTTTTSTSTDSDATTNTNTNTTTTNTDATATPAESTKEQEPKEKKE